jgi:hypothetical protein
MCGDTDVVLDAVQQDGNAFRYAVENLKKDKDFIRKALNMKMYTKALNYVLNKSKRFTASCCLL